MFSDASRTRGDGGGAKNVYGGQREYRLGVGLGQDWEGGMRKSGRKRGEGVGGDVVLGVTAVRFFL